MNYSPRAKFSIVVSDTVAVYDAKSPFALLDHLAEGKVVGFGCSGRVLANSKNFVTWSTTWPSNLLTAVRIE